MKRITSKSRKGVAAVELAVCLPVLALLVMGTIELSSFIFLKQGLTAAAYEGVRTGIRPSATTATTDASVTQVLNGRRLNGATISISPSVNVERGQKVTVTVSAPSNANRLIFPRFVRGVTVNGAATMVKE